MSNTDTPKASHIIISFLTCLALIPASTILNGWAFMILWGWFAVPIFQLPPLTLAASIGVGLILAYNAHGLPKKEKAKNAQEATGTVQHLVFWVLAKPAIYLACGWVTKYFMH